MTLKPRTSGCLSEPSQSQQLERTVVAATPRVSLVQVLSDAVAHRWVDVVATVERLRGDAREKLVVVARRHPKKQPRWSTADVPEARADLLYAIYERIVVVGRTIVAARLTPATYSNGLALARPQVVMARPEGAGRALATYEIPIEGRDEWFAAGARQPA